MRNPSLTALSALCAALFLGSCQSGPQLSDTWSALEFHSPFEVEYSGELRAHPLSDGDGSGPFQAVKGEQAGGILDAGMSKPPQQFVIRAWLYQMSDPAVQRLLPNALPGGSPNLRGGKINREKFDLTLEAMTEAGDGQNVSTPSIICNEAEQAWVTLVQQTAYLEGFTYKRAPNTVIADPEVGVFHSGIALGAIPAHSALAGEASIEFNLTMSDLLDMETVTAEFPRNTAPLSMQVPVFSQQNLRGQVNLAPDEVAFLPYFYTTDGQRLMIFLSIEAIGEGQEQL